MSEIEILRFALWAMGIAASTIGAGLIYVVVWNAKAALASIAALRKDIELFQEAVRTDVDALRKTLQDEMRGFDRRVTRLETKAGLNIDAFERDEAKRRAE